MEKTNLKYIFFGTDEFSTTILDELEKAGMLPALIICPPDRPRGRGMLLTPPQTKVWAQGRNIQVYQPEKLDEDTLNEIRSKNTDLHIVASYGKILPKTIVDMPPKGTLNVHPSLLPKWRGASPIESQILNDEKEIGVTIMLMDEKMDHGPILEKEVVEKPYWPMRGSELQKLLAEKGGRLLAGVIPKWIDGSIEAKEQNHEKATFSKKIVKEDGLISLEGDAYENLLKIRAFDSWPRTYFFDGEGTRYIITEADVKNGDLVIKRVIPEGKKETDWNK